MGKFDYLFYLELYPDLRKAGIERKEQAYQHYMMHGIHEGRIGHPDQMKKNMKEGLKQINLENRQYIPGKKTEEKINILIRTSNRPTYFQKCIQSILEQKYENYRIIICYDKEESLAYLNRFENDSRITYFSVSVESKEKYRFNLYCNILMDRVEEGWVMFLDDDDMLCHDKVLSMINEHLSDKNSLYLWKFLRPDKVIYPKDINNIQLGEIATTSACFHSIHKEKSRWPDKQCGDYAFYSKLNQILYIKQIINNILTRTIDDEIIGNFGD
jgi:glycosyltransferase involved in cell wall biosynthesis